ncbi:unnamed protein product [Pleuronectes platessa]|uniref:Uncharacterized protein n=1 Tax=Pleuronectes platessa TaxID=8262 RepID=A0A9N7VJE7_PLEPL|nr:unnamed protein product [Pleuronectes platessa]
MITEQRGGREDTPGSRAAAAGSGALLCGFKRRAQALSGCDTRGTEVLRNGVQREREREPPPAASGAMLIDREQGEQRQVCGDWELVEFNGSEVLQRGAEPSFGSRPHTFSQSGTKIPSQMERSAPGKWRPSQGYETGMTRLPPEDNRGFEGLRDPRYNR